MDPSLTQNATTSKSKRKIFLWNLKPEWIAGLLCIMSEYVDINLRSAQGFKESVYHSAAQKIKEKFGVEVTAEQCKNQIRHQRTVWTHIQKLKNKSGVSWDENKKIILMGQEEYASHIQAFSKDVVYLNILIANYVQLEKVCGVGHATGEWAKSRNSETPLGTQEIHLGHDEASQFMDDVSISSESPNVQVLEDSRESTKRSLSSSAIRGVRKKKSKITSTLQSIHENISRMPESVDKVANALNPATKTLQERRMFTELTTELASVLGFSEEETDMIFDKLANNPTMIQAFLSKSTDSKARWMRRELGT